MNVRRQWKRFAWLGALACGMAISQTSHAALVYEYVSDKSSYTAKPGDFINVLLYLKETVTGTSTSLITADGNMLGAGVGVSRSATGLPSSPSAFVTDGTSVTRNLVDFSGPGNVTGANGQGAPTATDVALSEAAGPPPAVPPGLGNTGGGAAPSVPNEVYLGSVKILAGSQAGTTMFSVRVRDPGFGNTLTNGNFYDLDKFDSTSGAPAYTGASQKTNTFSIVVSDVPEPASLGLLIGVGMLGVTRRRRR
jgi:hypothetical protein